jgi:hypothetical protein
MGFRVNADFMGAHGFLFTRGVVIGWILWLASRVPGCQGVDVDPGFLVVWFFGSTGSCGVPDLVVFPDGDF